jgi:hypothetical protein
VGPAAPVRSPLPVRFFRAPVGHDHSEFNRD